jgi:hypothetical protein
MKRRRASDRVHGGDRLHVLRAGDGAPALDGVTHPQVEVVVPACDELGQPQVHDLAMLAG